MNGSITSNLHLLGINDMTLSSLREGRLLNTQRSGQPRGLSLFEEQLAGMLGANEEDGAGKTVRGINPLDCTGSSLSRVFMDSALAAMIPAGTPDPEASNGIIPANPETETTGSLLPNNDPLAGTLATVTTTGTTGLSPMEVVFSTGNSNRDLLDRINAATTLEERLGYVTQLRDKIIEALRQEGHTAYDIGKPDKISINGALYDVVRASKALGNEAAVHFLEVPPATASTQMAGAIFTAGESLIDLLPRISASFDPAERRQLATQFRDQLLEKLNADGYTASAGQSPDKIVVDGVTYDIIRNLNAPGSAVRLQAIKVK